MKNFSLDIVLGIDWLIFTNPLVYWVVCSLVLIVGANQHTKLAFPVTSVANVTLSSLKQVLAEVKRGHLHGFCLLYPHSTRGCWLFQGRETVPWY